MRVAFYAPLKAPDHPVPSGDRLIARLLIAALERAGHQPVLASRLRSLDKDGDGARQRRLARLGGRLAARCVGHWRRHPDRAPDAWLTYHLYHKAPDWIGPTVCRDLGIPYLAAEVSAAARNADGPWAPGHRAVVDALGGAATAFVLSPVDRDGVLPHLADPGRLADLTPFIDPAPLDAARTARDRHRADLAREHGLDPHRPWLVTVAMMRPGVKVDSYRVLADACRRLGDRAWHLLIIGDGPAESEVRDRFAGLDPVRFLGRRDAEAIAATLAAGDLFAWPAVGEAFGMVFLEAQAAGLPVVAGLRPGVANVLDIGGSAAVAPVGDADAFARAIGALLDDPGRRTAMAAAARAHIGHRHHIDRAAERLNRALHLATGAAPP